MQWMLPAQRFSNVRRRFTLVSCGLAIVMLSACAPKSMIDGVPWVISRHGKSDASVQRVDSWPCIRLDSVLIDDLEAAVSEDDLDEAQDAMRDVLGRAHQLALTSTHDELDRLEDAGWEEIRQLYFNDSNTPGWVSRERIRQDYLDRTEERFQTLISNVDRAGSLTELRLQVRDLEGALEKSIKTRGRLARALPWFLFSAPSAIAVSYLYANEDRSPLDHPFKDSVRYMPRQVSPGADHDDDPLHWLLLNRYAPVLVQERDDAATYASYNDRLGTVVAIDEKDIRVDTSAPAAYGYARDLNIGNQRYIQLVYTFWYPAHPPLKEGFDSEAGHIDGSVLRITLDQDEHPLVFESMLACGCYHRTYPTGCLERLAREINGPPMNGKTFSIEREVAGKYDLIIPELVDDELARAGQLVIRAAAGYHALIDIAFSDGTHRFEESTTGEYVLRPYEELTHLELPDGRKTSMFYDNGLVKGAHRVEGVFFTPIGILSSGQPRQRGTHLIHWDDWDFDDPNLFEQALRWPINARGSTFNAHVATKRDSQ